MVRSTSSPRWSGDNRHPSEPQSEPRKYVDFGEPNDSEAAVERWLTSPAKSLLPSSKRSTSRSARNRPSHTGSIEVVPSSRPGGETQTQTTVSSPGGPTRGARLLKERLRQRARKDLEQKAMKVQKQSLVTTSTSTTMPQCNHTMPTPTMDSADFLSQTQRNVTPPSTASPRTLSSKASSFRKGGSLVSPTASQSPSSNNNNNNHISEHGDIIPIVSNNSMNEARHPRRSIEKLTIEVMSPPTSPVGVGRASVRASPIDSNNSVFGAESPSLRTKQQMFFGPDSPKKSFRVKTRITTSIPSIYRISDSSSSSTEPTNDASSKTTEAKLKQRTNSEAFKQPQQQQESDEEREKNESKVQRTTRQVQHDRRQAFTPPGRTNRIRLHAYDLIAEETVMQLPWGCHFPIGQCFNAVNTGLHTLGTGAYHVGIEINGVEYAYGANETCGATGVFTCLPQHSPGYQYRTTIDFGDRALLTPRKSPTSRRGDDINYSQASKRYVDGREVVREMAAMYIGTDYDLLRKNCCTFAHDACLRLGVKEEDIPTWFRNLCGAGALTQDAATSTIEPLSKVFSACDMETLSDYMTDTGFEVIKDDDQQNDHDEEIVDTEDVPKANLLWTSMV